MRQSDTPRHTNSGEVPAQSLAPLETFSSNGFNVHLIVFPAVRRLHHHILLDPMIHRDLHSVPPKLQIRDQVNLEDKTPFDLAHSCPYHWFKTPVHFLFGGFSNSQIVRLSYRGKEPVLFLGEQQPGRVDRQHEQILVLSKDSTDRPAYYSPGNQFERFRSFWNQLADSNSIFVIAEFFFERFEFLVC